MEYINEVVIREVPPQGKDKAFVLTNLPKKFIFQPVAKLVPKRDRDGNLTGDLVPDPSGEMVEGLRPGIERFRNRKDEFLFFSNKADAMTALAEIDAYVSSVIPRDVVIPKRDYVALDPTDMRSSPKDREDLPKIELPLRDAPQVSPAANAVPGKRTRTLTPEQQTAARERMARARAAAAAKREASKQLKAE